MEKLSEQDLLQAKTTALKMSRDLHPNTINQGNVGTLGYGQSSLPPSIDLVLKDAKVIFEWLTSKN